MNKADNESRRLGAHPEMQRLDPHPEAHRLEGHPEPDRLPAHEEKATPLMTPADGKVAATSDAREVTGIARGAGWVALAILAIMVVATFLWPTRVSTSPDMTASSVIDEYQSTFIAAIPLPDSQTGPQTVNSATGTTSGADAVVIYLFNTDSDDIPETASLTNMARLARSTGKTVVVKAYTDETGSRAYNQRLSERRAGAVGDYMVAHGVPASRIKAKGYGPTHAYATNAQDRRAEVSLE